MSATQKQIETMENIVNEINAMIAEAKASANYSEYEHLIRRALSGVMVCNDDGGTMVETARKSGDRSIYSTTISLLIRTKQRVQNIIDSWN